MSGVLDGRQATGRVQIYSRVEAVTAAHNADNVGGRQSHAAKHDPHQGVQFGRVVLDQLASLAPLALTALSLGLANDGVSVCVELCCVVLCCVVLCVRARAGALVERPISLMIGGWPVRCRATASTLQNPQRIMSGAGSCVPLLWLGLVLRDASIARALSGAHLPLLVCLQPFSTQRGPLCTPGKQGAKRGDCLHPRTRSKVQGSKSQSIKTLGPGLKPPVPGRQSQVPKCRSPASPNSQFPIPDAEFPSPKSQVPSAEVLKVLEEEVPGPGVARSIELTVS